MRSHFVPAPSRPACRYGATCYQLGAAHWRDFDHPDTHPRLETTANKMQKLDHDLGGDTEEDEPTPTPLAVPAPPPPQPAAALPASLPVVPAVVIAAALPAPSSAAPTGADPLGPLADMESRSVQGSGANVYELKRVGDTYSCSCPSWRNQKGAGSMRTCKHLKALRGEQAELERLGGDPKAFFASGNRVAGQAAAAGAGVAPTNEAVVKTVALADSWDGVRDLTGWALSEKLDGMRCLWDGKGGCFSRAGKEVYVPASLCLQLPLGTALDGELWLGRGQFQRAMSIVRRTDRSESAWAPIEYVVYDAPEAPGGIFDRLAAARAALAAVRHRNGLARRHQAPRALQAGALALRVPNLHRRRAARIARALRQDLQGKQVVLRGEVASGAGVGGQGGALTKAARGKVGRDGVLTAQRGVVGDGAGELRGGVLRALRDGLAVLCALQKGGLTGQAEQRHGADALRQLLRREALAKGGKRFGQGVHFEPAGCQVKVTP